MFVNAGEGVPQLEQLQSDPLFAILPAGREVKINNGKARVVGVSWTLIGDIVRGFPQLVDLFDKIASSDNGEMIKGGLWIASNIPQAIPTILAAGIGRPGDPAAEAIMGRLDAIAQLDLLNEVLKETIGGDLDFFVAKLKAVGATIGFGAGDETTGAKIAKAA